ncbi:hypothetical protein J2T55_001739 [Methylohalomonas lacus]|uniref:Alpha-amylase n=1 Tax=Methylohalomonas lacus TaxID=398773 RepID=A0AAE3HLZ2_9GAMM|nr:transporter [Methylohalomonas lacus]MCS3903708.1 hypothetical protein [Methylohalomonas lacus]
MYCRIAVIALLAFTVLNVPAHESPPVGWQTGNAMSRADGHAPIGVMGDHMHGAGEWMISYRFMHMDMAGNHIGTDDVSPEDIVTGVPNRFADQPMQPSTLRVVPTSMDMQMHMFGAMYAPTDSLTLMAMGRYHDKQMDHVTFQGGTGTDRLGSFTTGSSGIGDTSLTGLIKLYDDGRHHLHLNLGVSLPTGSITEEDTVLTPMGTTPTMRLPYGMQLGSGTFDLLPGITYSGKHAQWGWGAQFTNKLRLGRNDEGYSLGDEHHLTAWGSYLWRPWISTSVRLAGQHVDRIDGRDDQIMAPVQTADPDNYGGDRVDLLFGVNLAGQPGTALAGHRLAAEVGTPVHQDLNGPQLETDWTITVGYQFAWD